MDGLEGNMVCGFAGILHGLVNYGFVSGLVKMVIRGRAQGMGAVPRVT